MQLESELEKLKAEKELGWVDNDTNTKMNIDKEMLNQEIARLNEKVKRTNNKLEELKKKEAEWTEKENKYQTTCKNFKKTITEMKKEQDNSKNVTKATKSFENMFSDHAKLKSTYEETIRLLYSLIHELTLENQILREDRSRNRNFNVDAIEASMKLFDFDESAIKV